MKITFRFPLSLAIAILTSTTARGESCLNPQLAAARISGVGTLRPAGGVVGGVAIADLNGDTNADLVAVIGGCAFCTPPVPNNLSVLLGNGDGTFATNVNYASGELPSSIVVGDLTGDLRPEVVASFMASASVAVFVNNGDGTFQAPVSVTFSNFTSVVQLLDMNDDGKLDLVGDAAQVRLGNGNGTFQTPINFASGVSGGLRPAVGDFDGNGTDDIAFPAYDFVHDEASISTVLGSTSATFQTLTNSPVSVVLTSLAAGNFNGDAFPDVVGATGSNYVSVCLNKGDGTFHPNADFAVVTNSIFVATGNFDGDSDDDIVVRTSGFTIVILLCNGNGTFQAGINYSYDGHAIPSSLVIGDVNGDGIPDIAGAGTGEALGIPILLGNGDGTFQAAPKYSTGDGPLSPQAADFNKDGFADLIVANNFSNNVSVLLNNGDGTFGSKSNYPAGKNAESIAIGDFNNDGNKDIAVANQNSNVVSLVLGKGNGTFFNSTIVGPVVVGSGSVLAGRFDGDTNDDVVVVGMSATTFQAGVLVFRGTGFGTFATPLVSAGPTIGDRLVAAQLNADAFLDLVVGKVGQNIIQTMLGNGDGTFQSPTTLAAGTNLYSVAVGDFNNDASTDIVTANLGCQPCTGTYVNGSISVLLGNGNGTFQNAVTHIVSPGGQMFGVAVADFTGDGNADVAVTSSLGTIWVLAGNGNGTFRPGVQFGVQNTPGTVVAADLDGDGRLDLATANKAVDTLSVLLNHCFFDVVPPTNNNTFVCTLAPTLATNTVGTTHTVTGTVTSNGNALVGAVINFTVTGANAGNSGSATTGVSGQGSFTYTGTNAGTDTIRAIAGGVTGTVTKVWITGGGCPTITVSPTTLPAGTVSTAYSQAITASGGQTPYTFAVTIGNPPGGLNLSNSGTLSGTPTNQGVFGFTITATDANACTGQRPYTLTVNAAPVVAHDLAVTAIKAPKKVTLKTGTTPKPGKLSVSIQNLGAATETIPNAAALDALLNLQITSLGGCTNPVPTRLKPTTFPVILAPKKKLTISYTLAITCANDPLASSKTESHADYRYSVTLDLSSLAGQTDAQPDNDVCPRVPGATDKGCAKGMDVTTDVLVKQ